MPDAAVKKSVRAATTANITLSGVQTVDGITLVAGDRVLVKDQSTASANGIYIVSATAWTRSTDADTSTKLAGSNVNVDSGTVNGGLRFDTGFKTTDTLGTTNLTWYRVVDTGLASTVVGTTPGTAAIGTSINYARADHVHPVQTTVSGNAGTATKLATARTISTTGDATWSVSFDGSANVTSSSNSTVTYCSHTTFCINCNICTSITPSGYPCII
jgi:phage-related tail fiber protein